MSTPQLISFPAPGPSNDRLLGLDWLRAVSAVLVVLLHAAIPYMSDPLPGLKWSIEPVEQSNLVSLIGWGINGFIMPVFFLITGYFAAQLLQRRGVKGFILHRLRRLGGPLLFAIIVILPLDLYAWLFGLVSDGLVPVTKMRSLKVEGELRDALLGISHLWYLEYVLTYCLIGGLLSHLKIRFLPANESPFASRNLTGSRWRAVLVMGLAILICGSLLWWQPRIVIGFRNFWFPRWENFLFYAVPFSLGWFWNRWTFLHRISAWNRIGQLALAVVCFALLWPMLRSHVAAESRPVTQAALPFLFAAFNVLTSTALFGLALSCSLRSIPPSVAYVSRASFWIYLFHHPIVGLTQVDLKLLSASPEVKFLLTGGIALGTCLLTYEGLVRTTWIGQLLNGKRELPRSRRIPAETLPALPERRQAA